MIGEFFIIVIGRLLAVTLTYWLFSFCRKKDIEKLTLKEQLFISYAAMIRGAVAFALVLNIEDSWQHKEIVVSSTIMLIILTTIVFGSTTALAGKFLLGDSNKNSMITQSKGGSNIMLEYVKEDQPPTKDQFNFVQDNILN